MGSNTIARTSGNKLSKKERGIIVELIVGCLLSQYRRSQIIAKLEPYNLSTRSIDKYIHKCHEMIATRPLEAVERARSIEYSKIEQKQTECEHTRDWTELEKLKLKIVGLDNITIDVNVKDDKSISDDALIEVVTNE